MFLALILALALKLRCADRELGPVINANADIEAKEMDHRPEPKP